MQGSNDEEHDPEIEAVLQIYREKYSSECDQDESERQRAERASKLVEDHFQGFSAADIGEMDEGGMERKTCSKDRRGCILLGGKSHKKKGDGDVQEIVCVNRRELYQRLDSAQIAAFRADSPTSASEKVFLRVTSRGRASQVRLWSLRFVYKRGLIFLHGSERFTSLTSHC